MLGARIAALRRSTGMNQAQLAKKLQISASAVGMYEQGRREPSLEILAAMARVFDVSIDFLVTGKPSTATEATRIHDLLLERMGAAELKLEKREGSSFTRQELVALFAAMLMEP